MKNKLSINRWIGFLNIVFIISQSILGVMEYKHSISISELSMITIISAIILIILDIISLIKSKSAGISISGSIIGIIGSLASIHFGIIGWIILIISSVQLFRQKSTKN
ncbi:hypothetical protein DY120_04120 [Apilactobacillus micheneri]|uniref:Uncharacterized protein n=1 Tax=Apilactobacillus micheneri TaxID=1899430 RepID=A0ABY2YVW1_9LACO|nr:hypothetical protein [Apilactobacillus micheneri]TPR24473.1 hypothetical protein DY114_04120 [Apilactobacillus micheneri]TPR25784.1 hypothetical protein DY111_04120 [Apilactobacillus micheneri]TPR27974.1 hypothetical protein DY113_02065 [Apilactobacillus micheneri]TPR29465.1 hypothetical protein DY117_04120 [Apilactobacillus micheneri]TPR30251.1 hypothetical protein DY120_04120 [Apilactobacillus micheneri]